MTVSVSDWLLMPKSSVMAQLTLFSVVNIPLTSLYAHRAITRDCCWEEGLVLKIEAHSPTTATGVLVRSVWV